MSRRTLDRSHTYQEVQQHFDHHPAVTNVRQTGSHRIYSGPRGSVVVPIGHRGDVPRGTLRSIMRMAALAGLALFIAAVALGALMPFVG